LKGIVVKIDPKTGEKITGKEAEEITKKNKEGKKK